jgi:hypothetical protein
MGKTITKKIILKINLETIVPSALLNANQILANGLKRGG